MAMKAEELALVQGWDDTRRTLRALDGAAGRSCGRGCAGRWPSPPLLLATVWLVATLSTPDPRRGSVPGADGRRPARRDYAFVLYRNGARAGAARAGLRGRLHGRLVAADRRRAATAACGGGCTTAPGRSRSRFVIAATLFSLAHPGVRARAATPPTLAGAARHLAAGAPARPAPARAARADGAVPAARGVDARAPPRRLGGAARRDVRDRRDRRAGAGRGRAPSSLGDAADPRSAILSEAHSP